MGKGLVLILTIVCSAILHLDSTQLEGSLPADLGDLTNLGALIPRINVLCHLFVLSSITSRYLISAELLDLGNTHLSGSIPTSIGRLTKLGMTISAESQFKFRVNYVYLTISDLEQVFLIFNEQVWKVPSLRRLQRRQV